LMGFGTGFDLRECARPLFDIADSGEFESPEAGRPATAAGASAEVGGGRWCVTC